MRFIVSIILVLGIYALTTFPIFAQVWYYPMDKYSERQKVKSFGLLIDDEFYKGREHLFPHNRFYGYHTAVDLEYLIGEKNKDVPVYAVTTGNIKYVGNLLGYGGLILQDIGDGGTALYGHVKLSGLSKKIGDEIQAGEMLTYLGDEFSNETSKERKHLHFGIYKGRDLYFRGHEESKEALERKWIDPTKFLEEKGAVLPRGKDIEIKRVKNSKKISTTEFSFLDRIILWIKKFFL